MLCRTAAIAVLALLTTVTATPQTTGQLTPEQLQKRQFAVNLVRAINSAEMSYKLKNGRFGSFSELQRSDYVQQSAKLKPEDPVAKAFAAAIGTEVGGLEVRLLLPPDSSRFDISVRDTRNGSLWVVFSDERSVIYTGQVIQ